MPYKKIFKRYDIRGYYPQEINENFAYLLGKSIGEYILSHKYSESVVIGGDIRDATPSLKNALIEGLAEFKIKILDCGVVPTDMVAFMTKKYKNIGVMITASHNPYEMSGFKLIKNNLPFTNEMLKEIKQLFLKQRTEDKRKFIKKDYKEVHYYAYESYLNRIKEIFNIEEWTFISKAIWLTKNTSLSPLLQFIKENYEKNINFSLDKIYIIDTSLPPEPQEKVFLNMIKNREKVNFIFDPDVDRILIYDPEVGIIDGHKMLSAFALSENTNMLVCSLDFSEIYTTYLKNKGIKVYKTKIGDIFVSNEAHKQRSKIFGEPNNHFGFSEISYYNSGFVSAIYYLLHRDKIIKELKSLPKTHIENIKISPNIPIDEIVNKIEHSEIISKKDGIKIMVNDNTYLLIRKSGTENVIRVSIESTDLKTILEIKKRIKSIVV